MEGWWAASYVVLWLLVVTLAILVVALARQIGTLHLRLGPRGALELDDEGPPLGEAPAPLTTTDLDGRPITIGGPGRAQLILFVSPGCRVCDQVMPGAGPIAKARGLVSYLISDDDGHTAPAAYSVPGTPYAVVLDDRGIVRAKGTINNLEQMEGLVESAMRRAEMGSREVHAL
ncbi:MAG: hypothetical protein ACRDJI_12085 [Actinomycetota bacterium]